MLQQANNWEKSLKRIGISNNALRCRHFGIVLRVSYQELKTRYINNFISRHIHSKQSSRGVVGTTLSKARDIEIRTLFGKF